MGTAVVAPCFKRSVVSTLACSYLCPTPHSSCTLLCAPTYVTGVLRFCFKKVSITKNKIKTEVELDGVAYSESECLVVEKKPRINLENVLDLASKLAVFEWVL